MIEVSTVTASVTEYAAAEGLVVIPAVPDPDYATSVRLSPDRLDLDGFLALARRLAGGVLYLEAAPFTGRDADLDRDLPEHLAARRGQVGMVTVAFAANGLVHFWQLRTSWYQEWEQWRDDDDVEDWPDGEDRNTGRLDEAARAELTAHWIRTLLEMPTFRAAKFGARFRVAERAIPPDVLGACGSRLVREACEQAQEIADQRYQELALHLDDLAAELAADPDYRHASSAAGKKEVAEQFLRRHADGYSPRATTRDELHSRTQRLTKTSASLF